MHLKFLCDVIRNGDVFFVKFTISQQSIAEHYSFRNGLEMKPAFEICKSLKIEKFGDRLGSTLDGRIANLKINKMCFIGIYGLQNLCWIYSRPFRFT